MILAGEADYGARRERFQGIALICAAFLCFACLDASAKFVNQSLHPILTTWARYLSSVILITAVLNPISRPGVMRTSRPALQAARSLLLLVSTALNFIALRYLQLTETTSIQFSTPLLVALLAGPMLGEWAGRQRVVAIVIGFMGVLVITRPGLGGMHPAAILSVISTLCYALYNITTRMLSHHDSSATTLIYSGAAGMILVTPLVPFVWTTPSSPLVWLVMGATGAFGAVGHGLLILAHAKAPAPVLTPFIYSQILWSILLGYVVFGDLPDRWTLAGGVVVIASGLYLILHDSRRMRRDTPILDPKPPDQAG